jgi:cyclopropane fatty-acyl-phospholipid synthase-like methyltransferase
VLEKGKLLNTESDYEVELRLIERADHSVIPMLRLFTLPDQRFAYRKETTAQSTAAPLAALAAELARPYLKEGAQVLDPFCGAATLLIERCLAVPADPVYGIDHLAEAIGKAKENSVITEQVKHAPIHFINRDFFDFTHEYPFDEIIPVSALRSVNLDSVLEAIFEHLPEGPMYYDEETVTDQTMRTLSSEIIREKALRCLNEEVPHGIAVEIQSMKERKRQTSKKRAPGARDARTAAQNVQTGGRNAQAGVQEIQATAQDARTAALDIQMDVQDSGDMIWDIEAVIITEKDSHKGIIIGKGGSMLKKIATQARLAIEEMVGEKVNLKVFVKVRKDWRDNAGILRSLGYDPNRKA